MRVVNENTANAKAGEGKGFFVAHIFLSVADNETVYLKHKSGEKFLHSILDINTVGQWRFTSYSGFTTTDDGTVIPGINRRSDSPFLLNATFWHSPTVTVQGTPRLDFMFGSETSFFSTSTSAFDEEIESVFAPDAEVLIGLENLSGGTQYLSVIFNVHEED